MKFEGVIVKCEPHKHIWYILLTIGKESILNLIKKYMEHNLGWNYYFLQFSWLDLDDEAKELIRPEMLKKNIPVQKIRDLFVGKLVDGHIIFKSPPEINMRVRLNEEKINLSEHRRKFPLGYGGRDDINHFEVELRYSSFDEIIKNGYRNQEKDISVFSLNNDDGFYYCGSEKIKVICNDCGKKSKFSHWKWTEAAYRTRCLHCGSISLDEIKKH